MIKVGDIVALKRTGERGIVIHVGVNNFLLETAIKVMFFDNKTWSYWQEELEIIC